MEDYSDILSMLKADRPPRTLEEALDCCFETEQLARFIEDICFLLSVEDGAGAYLTENKTLRAFSVVSQVFGIVSQLSENLKNFSQVEINRACKVKREGRGSIPLSA